MSKSRDRSESRAALLVDVEDTARPASKRASGTRSPALSNVAVFSGVG